MGRPNPTNPPRLIGEDPRPDPDASPPAPAPIKVATGRTVPRAPNAGSAIAVAAASVEATVLESDRAMLARNRDYLRAERSRLRVKIASLAEKAMQTLSDLCDEGVENPVRLRAAETILDRVGVQMGRGSGAIDASDEAAAEEGARVEYGALTPEGQRTLLRKAVAFLQAGQGVGAKVVQNGPAAVSAASQVSHATPTDSQNCETLENKGFQRGPEPNACGIGAGDEGTDAGPAPHDAPEAAPDQSPGSQQLDPDPGEGGGGG